ncbi:VanW family protein [Candidatus Peregrinibacteria bacterium]|nr:VanW family protein [Candidatus Peregrinibacteria bacterium]
MNYSFFSTAVLAFFLSSISAYAALPGEMNLKNEYQLFVLKSKDPNLWADYHKFYFQGLELQLSTEERGRIPTALLEEKIVRGVDRGYITQFLEENIAPKINQESQTASVYLQEDNIIIDGNIQRKQSLNIPLSVKIIEKALYEDIDEVELAVDSSDPLLEISPELSMVGIKDILAIGQSDFSGSSPARIHNIQTALKNYNGKLITSGETFSFNESLGFVDGSTGYKKELVIKGDQTIPEWGGGVCQVSSTLYRGVMLSGLPIEERTNHSYSVSYYSPAGSDATIYPGSRDLRFTNKTGAAILLTAHIKDEQLFFTLLGSKEEKSIDLFGPYITDAKAIPPTKYLPSTTLADGKKVLISQAHRGFTSTWFRSINGGAEKFLSVYQARPKVYKVGGLNE